MAGAGGYRFSSNGLVIRQKDVKAGDDTCGQRRGTQWGVEVQIHSSPALRAAPCRCRLPPWLSGLALSRPLTRF